MLLVKPTVLIPQLVSTAQHKSKGFVQKGRTLLDTLDLDSILEALAVEREEGSREKRKLCKRDNQQDILPSFIAGLLTLALAPGK